MCELELNDFGNSAHEWESVGIETETHCWEASDLTDYAIHVTKQLLQVVQKYKSMKCDCESKSPVANNSHNYIIKLKKKKSQWRLWTTFYIEKCIFLIILASLGWIWNSVRWDRTFRADFFSFFYISTWMTHSAHEMNVIYYSSQNDSTAFTQTAS